MKHLLIATAALIALGTVAQAAPLACTVADPSGTPLNVRTAPMGSILGAQGGGDCPWF